MAFVLSEDEVPVDGGLVAVGGFFVAGAEGVKWKEPAIFSSKRISFIGFGAVGVEADGEFVSDVARTPGVGVGKRLRLEFTWVAAAGGVDDFAVFEGEDSGRRCG